MAEVEVKRPRQVARVHVLVLVAHEGLLAVDERALEGVEGRKVLFFIVILEIRLISVRFNVIFRFRLRAYI